MSGTEVLRRTGHTTPLVFLATMFIVAGGIIHLREWLEIYRYVPAGVAGAAVVRVGFPLNAVASLVLVGGLAFTFWRRSRYAPHAMVAAAVFQVASLAALIGTRIGSLFGWSEPSWTRAAEQTRAVEIGALLILTAVAAIVVQQRRIERQRPALAVARVLP